MKKIDKIKIYEKKNFKKYFDPGLIPYETPNSFYYRQNFEIRKGIPEDLNHSYKYNSDGYRSDDFKNIGDVHEGKHILFAGCSETEGVGTKLENVWSHIVYQKITEAEKCSGFFNIGSKGLSIDMIFQQVLSYIEKSGKPDVLFINFPDLFKFYIWDERLQTWAAKIGTQTGIAYNLYDKFYLKDLKQGMESEQSLLIEDVMNDEILKALCAVNGTYFVPELISEEEYANSTIRAFRYFVLMEKLCRILGIDLFWGTWDMYSSTSIENSELFNNYTNIANTKSLYRWMYENGYDIKDLVARDGGHCGNAIHAYWAHRLFTAYKEKLASK
jgi:hypothetical protein